MALIGFFPAKTCFQCLPGKTVENQGKPFCLGGIGNKVDLAGRALGLVELDSQQGQDIILVGSVDSR